MGGREGDRLTVGVIKVGDMELSPDRRQLGEKNPSFGNYESTELAKGLVRQRERPSPKHLKRTENEAMKAGDILYLTQFCGSQIKAFVKENEISLESFKQGVM